MLSMGSYDDFDDVGESSGAYIVRIPCGPRYFLHTALQDIVRFLFRDLFYFAFCIS